MIINQVSRVHAEKMNLNPIVSILHRKFRNISVESHLNSYEVRQNQLNIYHFGGLYCLLVFFKFKAIKAHSYNVVVFHGTDLHRFNKDLSVINRLKSYLNYLSNIVLIQYSDYTYLVSDSLMPYVPKLMLKKVKILNLGVDLESLQDIHRASSSKSLAFVNNNNRGVKNYPLAKRFVDTHNLKINVLMGLNQKEFFAQLGSSYGLIVTSFQEGSPNVLKEALALGLAIITVDVGDCKSNISRFGGTLIDYNGDIVQEFMASEKYSLEYLSIDNTISQILNDFNVFIDNGYAI
ncbi:hypothetical protein N8991_03475 [Schleiferiaceae bacterium]|nr:hypothetical protein [Schleiferiaceae bacterium]